MLPLYTRCMNIIIQMTWVQLHVTITSKVESTVEGVARGSKEDVEAANSKVVSRVETIIVMLQHIEHA